MQSNATNIHYAILNGALISTMDEFYNHITEQLLVPNYFGNNLDAFEEVLADLDWIEASTIYIILINTGQLLSELPEQKEVILSILQQVDNSKVTILTAS